MKKVGILNVQFADNYGAVLLAFALQTSINKLGYDAETIDYRPIHTSKTLKEKIKGMGFKTFCVKVWKLITKEFDKTKNVNFSSEEKQRRFEQFRRKYLNRSKIYHKIELDNDLNYDIYVVGSDVVWKPTRIISEESEVYFLNFSVRKECLRVAYAASIGTDDQKSMELISSRFQQLILKFDSVSVREKTTVPFVERLYKKKVSWCIDPTLLLQKEDYDKLLDEKGHNSINSGEYIYVYLFEDNDDAFDLINYYSKKIGLPVICQCSSPSKIDSLLKYTNNDGPLEFIDRIRRSRYVITDSFHGTVFSIIYQKNFLTLSRGNISIRMQDLLSRLNLQDRYVANFRSKGFLDIQVEFDDVEKVIREWRDESMDYLRKALSGNINSQI